MTVALAVDSVWLPSTWVTGARKVWLASVVAAAVAAALKVSVMPEFTCVTTEPVGTFITAPLRLMPTTTPATPAWPVLRAPVVVTRVELLVEASNVMRGSTRMVMPAEPDLTRLTAPPPLFSKRLRNWAAPLLAKT